MRVTCALLLLLAVAFEPQVVDARPPEPCAPGRFLVTSSVLPPGGEPLQAVTIDPAGTLTIDGCGPVAVSVRPTRTATRLRARWAPCGDLRRLRLEARIRAPECVALVGRLRGRGYPSVRISATRSTCGDGRLDTRGGEECDASAADGDTLCRGSCVAATCRCAGVEPPRDLVATISGSDVLLAWTPPGPASSLTEARVVRRLNEPPAGADDPQATVLFAGTGAAAVDALGALLPSTAESSRTYHYAVFGCLPGGPCETTGGRTTLSPTVMQVLAAGGYVLHWRHAAADVCRDKSELGTAGTTTTPDWWKSCVADCAVATARQLNDAGRAEATTIGTVLRARGIPFGRVLTSEYCRNVQSAALMALGPTPEQSPAITFFVYDEPGRCDQSYALLAATPASGTNTGLVGHAGFTPACPVLSELEWGEAAIFKPDGAGGSTFVTRVPWDGWSALP